MKRVICLVVVGLLTVALGLTSCAARTTEAPPAAKTETTQTAPSAKPVLKPASFSVSGLTITPAEVTTGSKVTIEVLVTNNGELPGTYDVILKIDGTVETTQNVTLAGGASQNVTFTTSKATARTYAVAIGELTGSFVVKAPPPSPKPSSPPVPAQNVQMYLNPVYGWAVSYPSGWVINSSNPASVQLQKGQGEVAALVSITSTTGSYATPDDFVNFMLAFQERRWKERGGTMTVTSRKLISLPNNVTAADIVMEIEPGSGKARHIYVLVDKQAYTVVAETYAPVWDMFSQDFDRIINSFTVRR